MNKIINIDELSIFDEAKTITGYWELCKFFAKFPISFYKENNIYVEEHHIYPKAETYNQILPWTIYLPFKYHFLAHYFRSNELKTINKRASIQNYQAAIYILSQGSIHKSKIDEIIETFPEKIYNKKQEWFDIRYENIVKYWSTKEKKIPKSRSLPEHILKRREEIRKLWPVIQSDETIKKRVQKNIGKKRTLKTKNLISQQQKLFYQSEQGKNKNKQLHLTVKISQVTQIYKNLSLLSGVYSTKQLYDYGLSKFYLTGHGGFTKAPIKFKNSHNHYMYDSTELIIWLDRNLLNFQSQLKDYIK